MSVDPRAGTRSTSAATTPIWRELEDALRSARRAEATRSSWTRRLSDLFAYVELESEERWQAISQTEVCRRWWRHMREIMPSNPDDSPVSRELRAVFHIEGGEPKPR